MQTFQLLHTERFLLRKFKEDDLENIYKGLSHPDVIRYYGISYSSLAATRDQLLWYNNLEESETGIWWAICNKHDNTFLGAIGFNNLSKTDKQAEIGFWLLHEYWGKNIITEAAHAAFDYAFKVLGLIKIEAVVELENVNCIKVLNRLGFKHQETRKNCEVKNDQYISLAIYIKTL